MAKDNIVENIEKEDEVYLIFPYAIVPHRTLDLEGFKDTVKTYPLWDILIVPNFLLEEPINIKDSFL